MKEPESIETFIAGNQVSHFHGLKMNQSGLFLLVILPPKALPMNSQLIDNRMQKRTFLFSLSPVDDCFKDGEKL